MHTAFDKPRPGIAGSHLGHVVGPTVRPAGTALDWAHAGRLLREHATWIEVETGVSMFDAQPDLVTEIADLCGAYGSGDSVLLVADDGDEVCGIVAIRRHGDGSAELKRMYVRPTARGRGHAGRLVREAIRYAQRWQASHVWLETLPGVMDTAIGLYGLHGFRQAATSSDLGFDGAIVMTRDLGRSAPP